MTVGDCLLFATTCVTVRRAPLAEVSRSGHHVPRAVRLARHGAGASDGALYDEAARVARTSQRHLPPERGCSGFAAGSLIVSREGLLRPAKREVSSTRRHLLLVPDLNCEPGVRPRRA
jgi:hypothetical protein